MLARGEGEPTLTAAEVG